MKTTYWLNTVLVLALGLGSAVVRAAAPASSTNAPAAGRSKAAPGKETNLFPTPLPAVAKQSHINVRGQTSLNSEVVTRLEKGQRVEVLEEITLKKPKADEPGKWFRIALPTNAPVWASTLYLTSDLAVKATRLNLRAGPGENFSVLGRVDKGTYLKELERKGDWVRVEAPTNTGAFVAAHLLTLEPAGATVAVVPPPAPGVPEPKPVEPAPVTPPPPPPLPVVTVPASAPPTPVVEPKPVEPVVAPPPVTPPPPTPVVPAPVVVTPPVAATNLTDAATNTIPDELLPKRIVTREGLLQGSVSIQAPSYFELRSLDTHRIIDYVYSPNTNLVLKKFKGKRLLLTGEEFLDERWAHTPVLRVDSMELPPADPK